VVTLSALNSVQNTITATPSNISRTQEDDVSANHLPSREDRRLAIAGLRERHTCSVDEAAAVLGVGRSTAYAAARDGSLPTLRLSKRILVPTAKLLEMLGLDAGQ
jgi:excisionase family DNA binding protein